MSKTKTVTTIPTADELYTAIADGRITVQKHPLGGLFIYNYSKKTQYESLWDDVTKACRGLILDQHGDVVARPFPKFFNLSEHSRSDITFTWKFTATAKMDGSLGILYKHPEHGKHAIATRGSFVSDQALFATEWLYSNYPDFKPLDGVTYLFEIIYPENRIVIDYGSKKSLVLLAIIRNSDGAELFDGSWGGNPHTLEFSQEEIWPGEVVKAYDIDCHPRDVLGDLGEYDGTHEGLVLKFYPGTKRNGSFTIPPMSAGVRVKVKYDEYVELHRIVTGLSTKAIWEHLREGKSIDDLLAKIPDEFYDWTFNTAKELHGKYFAIEDEAKLVFVDIMQQLHPEWHPTYELNDFPEVERRDFAMKAVDCKHTSILFNILDGKSYADKIWKDIMPEYERIKGSVDETDKQTV